MAYTRVNWQDLPSTTTPRNATNLNKMDAGIKDNDDKLLGNAPMGNVVVESIRSKNMFDKNTLVWGSVAGEGSTQRVSTRQILWLEPGTYTFSSNISSTYRFGVLIRPNTPPTSSTSSYDSGWVENSSLTFTITTAGYCMMNFARRDNGNLSVSDIIGFNLQLEKGSIATTYTPYQQLDRPTILTGSGTINTTYIDTVENNHYEKSGNVVSYSFTMKTKGTWGATTQFITGLPKAKAYTRFLGVNSSNGNTLRFTMGINGDISHAYSSTTPSAGQTIEGHVVYMTED